MHYKQIKVENGIATPCNPNKQWTPQFDENSDHEWFKSVNKPWQAFETWLSQQQTLFTNAIPGIYPVSEFGEPYWRILEHSGRDAKYVKCSKEIAESSPGFLPQLFIEHIGQNKHESMIDDEAFYRNTTTELLTDGKFKSSCIYNHVVFEAIGTDEQESRINLFEKISDSIQPATPEQKGVEQGDIRRQYNESKISESTNMTGMQLLDRGCDRENELISRGYVWNRDAHSYIKGQSVIRQINLLAYNETEWQSIEKL